MAKAPITNRVKGKMWTDTMTIEFDTDIAMAVEVCFGGLKVEQMEDVLKNLNKTYEKRKASSSGISGDKLNLLITDDVMENTRS